MKKTLVLFFALLLFAAAPFAKGMTGKRTDAMPDHGRFEPGERIQKFLDLSDKQAKELEKLQIEKRKRSQKTRIGIQKLRLEIKELLLEDKIDYAKMLTLEEKINALRLQQAKDRIAHLKNVEKILNKEQFDKFKMHLQRDRKKGSRRDHHSSGKREEGKGSGHRKMNRSNS